MVAWDVAVTNQHDDLVASYDITEDAANYTGIRPVTQIAKVIG